MRSVLAFLFVFAVVLGLATAFAQQATIATPQTTVSDSFFEHMGTSWAAAKNWFFQFGPPGNPNAAAPPFGGFDPSAGANFGVGFGGGGFGGNLMGNFSQGSRRTMTSTTPSVTVTNGVPGYVADASVSPFVMGFVPVVGGFPTLGAWQPTPPMGNPVTGHPAVVDALQNVPDRTRPFSEPDVVGGHVPAGPPPVENDFTLRGPAGVNSPRPSLDPAPGGLAASAGSSASLPAMSVAEAERIRTAEAEADDAQARQFLERGIQAQADGKLRLARTYFTLAGRKGSPSLRQQAAARLTALGDVEDATP